VGDRNGKSVIYLSEMSNLCSMKTKHGRAESVDVVTVDSFLEDKETLDLIRMDVEGYEYNIAKGMTETLKKDANLLIEFHGHLMQRHESSFLVSLLQSYGFKVAFSAFDHGYAPNRFVFHLMRKQGKKIGRVKLSMDGLRALLVNGGCANVLLSK